MVEVKEVSKWFKIPNSSVEALRRISFDALENEFVSVVGPSGCGKSTLLRILAGLISADGGNVKINGRLVKKPSKSVGLLFQKPVLMPWKNVIDNILFPVQMLGLRRSNYETKVNELVQVCGLKGFERSYPFHLSGGMQQRVALARVLLYEPDVLLMDEPFASLDVFTRQRMGEELTKLFEIKRKTVLFITHSIEEAVYMSDRVLVMQRRPGKIIEDQDVDLARPRQVEQKFEREFLEVVKKITDLMVSQAVLAE